VKEILMKMLLIVPLVVIAVGGLAALVGTRLPRAHRASKQQVFTAPPGVVWALITDVDAYPAWRNDVKRVQRLPDRNGYPQWLEEGRSGKITFAVERMDPTHLLVTRISDPALPFGGSWTYEIEPAAGGTQVTITENGEIYNPMFRFMARFVFGYDGTIATYMTSLEAKLHSTLPRTGRSATTK
jgi:hypothetical protein